MSDSPEVPADRDEVDPADAEWLRRRSAMAPLVFGVMGLALSPILLGLILGPLGMRAGIDLWRSGVRRGSVAVGIAASFLAVVVNVVAALLWGATLSTVLLGRDAMRVTEGWRGKAVEPAEAPFVPSDGVERVVVLVGTAGNKPCDEALANLRSALAARSECRLVLVDLQVEGPAFGESSDTQAPAMPVRRGVEGLPQPLSGVSAVPTMIVIDRSGRIETALVGVRPLAEIDRILEGAAALDAAPAPSKAP